MMKWDWAKLFRQLDTWHDKIDERILTETQKYIRKVNRFYIKIYNRANDKRDDIIRSYQKSPENKERFIQQKRDYHNDRLAEFVENSNEPVRIVEYKGRLIQKVDPIYLDPESNLIKAHFYAPQKNFITAISLVISVPVIVFTFLVQKYMRTGLTAGAVKQ